MRKINKYFNIKGGEEEDEEEVSSDEDLEELVDFEDDVSNDNTQIQEEENIDEDTNKCMLKNYTMSRWSIIDNLTGFPKVSMIILKKEVI